MVVMILLLACGRGLAQESLWQRSLEEANSDRQQGRFLEAEKILTDALAESEKSGSDGYLSRKK